MGDLLLHAWVTDATRRLMVAGSRTAFMRFRGLPGVTRNYMAKARCRVAREVARFASAGMRLLPAGAQAPVPSIGYEWARSGSRQIRRIRQSVLCAPIQPAQIPCPDLPRSAVCAGNRSASSLVYRARLATYSGRRGDGTGGASEASGGVANNTRSEDSRDYGAASIGKRHAASFHRHS